MRGSSWSLYFEQDATPSEAALLGQITAMSKDGSLSVDASRLDSQQTIAFDYGELIKQAQLELRLREAPEHTLSFLACAYSDTLGDSIKAKLTVRLNGHGPVLPFRSLRACLVGTMVTIRGSVVRCGPVQPLVQRLAFACGKCRKHSTVEFVEGGRYRPPAKCPTVGCGNRQLQADPEHPETRLQNSQSIRLQEIANDGDDYEEMEGMPKCLDVQLGGSLVDGLIVGERVRVTGILKTADTLESNGCFVLYLAANQVESQRAEWGQTTDASSLLLSSGRGEKDFIPRLVQSLCPALFGLEMVKLAILLTIAGGTRHADDLRAEAHVLLVGDPGLGKSQLISAAAKVAPRGVFISGNTSTAAGLTATMTGEGGLEAGALVLADQGLCCLDEFDKMSDHRVLLDVMEQQTVTIAKAGVLCTLPARCSVLAAANPVGGHFNRRKGIEENLNLEASLLSRFDLIFILLDRPDPLRDQMLSEHLLLGKKRSGGKENSTQYEATSLMAKLKQQQNAKPFTQAQLRAYLTHIRQTCHPQLTREASNLLHEFYLQLRQQPAMGGIPITIRHLEAMIRLAEGRAKLEMANWVTESHAQQVIELM